MKAYFFLFFFFLNGLETQACVANPVNLADVVLVFLCGAWPSQLQEDDFAIVPQVAVVPPGLDSFEQNEESEA